jgi:hypothetical protein
VPDEQLLRELAATLKKTPDGMSHALARGVRRQVEDERFWADLRKLDRLIATEGTKAQRHAWHLFSKSVEFAAVWDGAIVPLDEELIDPVSGEPDCTPYVNGSPNACTWERYWKRVLRMYHAGSKFNFDGYDDAVWALTPQFEPVEVTP